MQEISSGFPKLGQVGTVRERELSLSNEVVFPHLALILSFRLPVRDEDHFGKALGSEFEKAREWMPPKINNFRS